MKFPLMTVLVITDEPKKWAHEVLKCLNKEYLINKHYKYSNVGYDITTPLFRFLIAKDTERIGIGYRFKMVKPEIPLVLDGGMNGVRSNCYRLLEKQKSSQISITISSDFCL